VRGQLHYLLTSRSDHCPLSIATQIHTFPWISSCLHKQTVQRKDSSGYTQHSQQGSPSGLGQDEDGPHSVVPSRSFLNSPNKLEPRTRTDNIVSSPPSPAVPAVFRCLPRSPAVPHCPRRSYVVTCSPLVEVVSGHGARCPC